MLMKQRKILETWFFLNLKEFYFKMLILPQVWIYIYSFPFPKQKKSSLTQLQIYYNNSTQTRRSSNNKPYISQKFNTLFTIDLTNYVTMLRWALYILHAYRADIISLFGGMQRALSNYNRAHRRNAQLGCYGQQVLFFTGWKRSVTWNILWSR